MKYIAEIEYGEYEDVGTTYITFEGHAHELAEFERKLKEACEWRKIFRDDLHAKYVKIDDEHRNTCREAGLEHQKKDDPRNRAFLRKLHDTMNKQEADIDEICKMFRKTRKVIVNGVALNIDHLFYTSSLDSSDTHYILPEFVTLDEFYEKCKNAHDYLNDDKYKDCKIF